MSEKFISILLVIFIISPLFFQSVQASVVGSTVSFNSCTAGSFISNQITKGLNDLETWITKNIKNWLIRRRIIPIPGTGIKIDWGSRVPVNDSGVESAVNDYKGVYTSKEGAQDIIARCAARELLTAMGQNINNVARTGGRDGGPAWVRNWRNFQLEAQYRGEGVFRGMLASTNLCNYFAGDLKNLFGANQKIDLTKIKTRASNFDSFQLKNGCTLPNTFDLNAYKQNFSSNGGWEAWSRLLEPQNNPYGALFQSLGEADKQRAIEESADLSEAGPTGFTSTRGRNAADNCAIRSTTEGRCLVYKDILTPGGVLSGAVMSGIESELQWVASTDEMSELIATAINVLVNRLWDLNNPNEGDYIVPGDITISPSPFPPVCGNDVCEVGEDSNLCPVDCGGGNGSFGNITVNFDITNDNGGTATVTDFQLFIDGELTAIGLSRVLPVGSYTVTSSGPSGYTLTGISGDCGGNGSFALSDGQSLVCTVTYDDN